jgi:hypothetical protein
MDPHLRICGPGACLRARTSGLVDCFTDFQWTLFDLNFTLKRYAPWAAEEGETVREIWIKTRKIVGTAFLNYCTLKFFTRVEGGDWRPQSAEWRVGVSWQIFTEPLYRILTSILVYVFLRLLLHGLYGPSHLNSFKSGVKKFNNSIETRCDDFSPVSKAVKTLWLVL